MTQENSGKQGKVTLVQIANAAHVSKSTVSLILNGKMNSVPISDATRDKVLAAVSELGYRPNAAAKALATGRSNTILMVIFGVWDWNLAERLRGAESYLIPAGYSTRMCTVDETVGIRACKDIIQGGQADGLLIGGLVTPENQSLFKEFCELTDEMALPVVALSDAFPSEYSGLAACIDDEGGAEMAVTHLIDHGHQQIALLGVADQRWADKRAQGYRIAHEKAGISVNSELISLGNWNQTWAYEETLRLLKATNFTAMFAMNDYMALAALAALRASGRRVPEDCAIVGFDNIEIFTRFVDPPLTSVHNPFYDVSRTGAELLINMINGIYIEQESMPVRLIVRRSCGCMG